MKKVTITRKHKYTQEDLVLYKGNSLVEKDNQKLNLKYIDEEKYKVEFNVDYATKRCSLKRTGKELLSELNFEKGKNTQNLYKSLYGDFYIEIQTNNILIKDNTIIVDYDVISSNDKDGYIVNFIVEEE